GPRGEPRDDPALHDERDDHHGQRDEHGGRRDLAPVARAVGHELNTATGTVCVTRPQSTTANMNWFHEKMNARMAAAAAPVRMSGAATVKKYRAWPAPSTRAASHRSCGSSSKNGIIIHVMNGSVTNTWLRVMPT